MSENNFNKSQNPSNTQMMIKQEQSMNKPTYRILNGQIPLQQIGTSNNQIDLPKVLHQHIVQQQASLSSSTHVQNQPSTIPYVTQQYYSKTISVPSSLEQQQVESNKASSSSIWLLVEWEEGDENIYHVINVTEILNNVGTLEPGKGVYFRNGNIRIQATIVLVSGKPCI